MEKKQDYPGINGISFKIVFKENWFKKGDILNEKCKVAKVIDRIWWRRILIYFKLKQKTNTVIAKLI